jgi:hypothetical protein
MTVYHLNPLQDRRWTELVERHPDASVFHTAGWLDALRRTYGYQPVVFTTSPPGSELRNGVVFCDIRSWLTGHRLVSLPFSDHCEPLVENTTQLREICRHLEDRRRRYNRWRYIEIRTRKQSSPVSAFRAGEQVWFHVLDLRPDNDALFRSFHKNSIQRKIRRAQRENLNCDEGRDEGRLRAFYRLLLLTRTRHQLPPQPFTWFGHLAACLGTAMTVRIARVGRRPVAAMLTLVNRDTMVFKYGVSDAAFHSLGGMPFLFSKAIEDARDRGCVALDLGRSDFHNEGLVAFKDRLGAARSSASYWRYPAADAASGTVRRYVMANARQVIGRAPDGVRAAIGRRLYRHAG